MKKLLIFILFLVSGCHIGWTEHGPYHHEAIIKSPLEIIENNDNIYFHMYPSIYKIDDDEYAKIDIDDTVYGLKFINNNFYVITSDSVNVYNEDFTLEKEYEIRGVKSLVIIDDIMYYNLKYSNDSSFHSYDLNSFIDIKLKDKFVNDIYEINGKILYSNMYGYLYFDNEILSSNLAKGLYKNNEFSFYYGNNIGNVCKNENKIELNYNDNIYYIETFNDFYFYKNIKIIDNKLVFSVYEYLNDDLCNSKDCVCHYGKSKIYEFDLNLLNLNELKEIEKESYIIDFDLENVTHYNNGKIIKNNELLKEIEIVQPSGTYYIYGEDGELYNKTKISELYLFEYNSKIYNKYFDYSKSVEDKYYN